MEHTRRLPEKPDSGQFLSHKKLLRDFCDKLLWTAKLKQAQKGREGVIPSLIEYHVKKHDPKATDSVKNIVINFTPKDQEGLLEWYTEQQHREDDFPDITNSSGERNRNSEQEEVQKETHKFVTFYQQKVHEVVFYENAEVARVKKMQQDLLNKQQKKLEAQGGKDEAEHKVTQDHHYQMGPNIKDVLKGNEAAKRKKEGL